MINVVVCIGSNCGERQTALLNATQWLSRILSDFKKSAIYETPCALAEGSHYLNCVVCGKWNGGIDELEHSLKDYERRKGRDEACRKRGDVPVDIDVVICDGEIIKEWDYRQKFFQIGFGEIIGL